VVSFAEDEAADGPFRDPDGVPHDNVARAVAALREDHTD
jgi:hypothetical protein